MQNVLCAAVGIASHQHGLEACTVYADRSVCSCRHSKSSAWVRSTYRRTASPPPTTFRRFPRPENFGKLIKQTFHNFQNALQTRTDRNMVKSSNPNASSTWLTSLCPRTHASPQTCHHFASSVLAVLVCRSVCAQKAKTNIKYSVNTHNRLRYVVTNSPNYRLCTGTYVRFSLLSV